MRNSVVGRVLGSLLALPIVVHAGAGEVSTGPAPLTSGSTESSGGPVEVRMGEVEILGEIERPGVFYIIPRRELELDLGRRTRDYSNELSQPLDPDALERWVRQRRLQP